MDCFCGGGGFLQEAFCLKRKFIGIDESAQAIILNQQWIKENSAQYGFLKQAKILKKQSDKALRISS